MWDAGTGSLCFGPLTHCSSKCVCSVAYSPNGRHLASGGTDGNIHIWDLQTGTLLSHLKMGQGAVHGIAFSPDGKRLACHHQCEIHVWELDDTGYGLKDSTGLLTLNESERSSIHKNGPRNENLRKVQVAKFLSDPTK